MRRDLLLIPAQVVAEFVEVGEADFLAKGGHVAVGVIPDARKVEKDGRGERVVGMALGVDRVANEEAKDVGLEAFGNDVLRGIGLEEHRHGLGKLAELGRHAAENMSDHFVGNANEVGVGLLRRVRHDACNQEGG